MHINKNELLAQQCDKIHLYIFYFIVYTVYFILGVQRNFFFYFLFRLQNEKCRSSHQIHRNRFETLLATKMMEFGTQVNGCYNLSLHVFFLHSNPNSESLNSMFTFAQAFFVGPIVAKFKIQTCKHTNRK